MVNPQTGNGYTPVANEILDQIIKLPLNGTQFRLLITVWRYTYGFSRKEHELSESFIAKATGISKRNISTELNNLIKMNIIIVVRPHTDTKPRTISFNKHYDRWSIVQQVKDSSTGEPITLTTGEGLDNTPGEEQFNQDNQIIKTNIKSIIDDLINNYTDDQNLKNTLYDFVEHRKSIKKPIKTKRTLELILNELNNQPDKIAVLNKSIMNGWAGVFGLDKQRVPAAGPDLKRMTYTERINYLKAQKAGAQNVTT